MWEAKTQIIMHSLTIPRALALLAGGRNSSSDQDNKVVLAVSTKVDDPDWASVQSPFMQDKAKTIAFKHKVVIEKNKLSYAETTTLDIYGRTFEPTDTNELTRC